MYVILIICISPECNWPVLTFASGYQCLNELSDELTLPQLHTNVRRFLHSRIFPDVNLGDDANLAHLPNVSRRAQIGIHRSASIVFHSPSEVYGPHGMHRKILRCNPAWYGQYSHYDTVLITCNPDVWECLAFGLHNYEDSS